MPTVSFVVNGSLARVSGRFVPLCRESAARAGWTAEFLVTDKAETGVTAARTAALDGADVVVAVGGDGTVRGCAEGLAGTGVPLGIVPHGTANLLARTVGIHPHPKAALATVLGAADGADLRTAPRAPRSIDRRIDLATADGKPFTAMAGIGLDAAVIGATRLKHQLGWLAYAMSGAMHLAVPPTRFSIRLDGKAPIERMARSVVVGNSGLLPGGFSLLPDARLDDGVLDVGVLAPHGPLGWTRVAARVLAHSHHQDRMLERFQARTVEITAYALLPREVDGEVVEPGSTMTVTVQPQALTVRVPATGRRSAAGTARLRRKRTARLRAGPAQSPPSAWRARARRACGYGRLAGMAEPLTLMAVHAHPDDEASGGGILAAYADQGIRTIVVTCTNGEYGDAPGGIKPGQEGHDPSEVARLRLAELDKSASILRVTDLETLGYHDSGMEDWAYKDGSRAFCNVPIEKVADRIGDLIVKYRPQVLVTYDDQGAYQHPDHVHASRAAQAAAAATGIPAKVYLSTMKSSNWRKIFAALREAGEEVPDWQEDDERNRRALESEERITATVDIRPVLERKRAALFAHGSQINDSWFSKIPQEVTEQAFGYEYFIRVVDTTGSPIPEDDLFAGLRTRA